MNEITTERTPTSKTYDLGNGLTRWSGGLYQVHYRDTYGWQEIAPALEADGLEGFSRKVSGCPFMARLRDDGGRRIYPVRNSGVIDESKWIEIGGFPAIGPPDEMANGRFLWQRTGFDLEVAARGPKLEKRLTLRNPDIATSWQFDVGLNNLQLDRAQLPWLIMDGDTAVAELGRPWAIDANGIRRWLNVGLSGGVLSLELDTSGLVYPLIVDPTLNLQVGASLDDGLWQSPAYFDRTVLNTTIGESYDVFLRFTNVTIPASSTISAAILIFTCKIASAVDTVRTNVAAEDAANPASPVSGADMDGRVRTTAFVAWDFTTDWIVDSTYSPGDLSTVIQEIVDRGDWASGNALQVFVDDDGSDALARRFPVSFDGSATECAKLDITYTVPSADVMLWGGWGWGWSAPT